MRKILLHACCAICAAYPVKLLREEGYEPVVYFYNPNIYPEIEYKRRLDELVAYSKKEDFELYFEELKSDDFDKIAKGYEKEPEKGKRCERCFYLRLGKAAQKAKELSIGYYTTTLTISPHKVTKQIFEAANTVSKETGIEFLPYDFKKKDGFKITQQIAKENNMYKQTYCGCKYSIREVKQQLD